MNKNVKLYLLLIIILSAVFLSMACRGTEEKDIISLLMNAKNRRERLGILNKNKDIITKNFIEEFLKDSCYNSFLAYEDLTIEEAGKRHDTAMDMADFLGDNRLRGIVMLYKAEALYMNNLDEALSFYDRAMEYFQKDNFLPGQAWCYYDRSIARYMATIYRDFDKIRIDCEKSVNIFRQLGMKEEEAWCICTLGEIYSRRRKKYEKETIECYKRALKLFEDLDIASGKIELYRRINSFYYPGDYSKIHYSEEKILELILKASPEELNRSPVEKLWPKYRHHKDDKHMILAWHYHGMGLTCETFGRFGDSIGYHKKALEILEKSEKNKDYLVSKSIFYEDLADIYGIIGKYSDALDYYDKAVEITKKTGNEKEISGSYFITGVFLLEAHMEEEAIKKFTESLIFTKEIEDPYFANSREISTMNKIGEAYLRLGDLKKAEYYATEAIKLEEKQDKPHYKKLYNLISEIYLKEKQPEKALDYMVKSISYGSTIEELLLLSRIYLAMDKNKEALEYAEKALAEAKEKKTKWRLWNFYLEEGKILEDLGETEMAIQIYKTSINIIEDTRNELKLEDYKRDFMKDKMEVYERLIKVLLKSGKEKEAFDYNERARARAFLDILANNRIDIHRGAPDNIIKKIDKLEDKIFYYSREDNRDDEILLKVKKEYEKIMEELKEKNPEYASLKSVSPLTTEKIQTLLDNDTAILEYFCGEEYLYIWIITDKKIFTKTVSVISKELKEKILLYREEISDNMTGEKLKHNEWEEKSRELYSILIGDMENLLHNKKRLYIVPHRTLHYLPFHTLCNSKGEVLVKNYEILYLPSATVLSYCRKKNTLKKEHAAAFGYGNLHISPYPSLPGTIKEVEAIKKLYPHTDIYKEKKMTKNTVKISSEHADILHFATHGILDLQSPVFSKLILSDGDLHVYEIFDMKLSASLVTLSACRTGLGGEISEGDELTGFSRAFIYAGTPCVCVSLWDVSDKATGEFMERFYLYLKENSRSESLRLAQIDMMEKYRHPFIWAPFILIGD